MGLFDFVKDIGHKLFTSDAEAAQAITDHINANNPGIDSLSVIFKEGKATLIGITRSEEAAQKAVLMAGNVKGVEEVVPKIDILLEAPSETAITTPLTEPDNVTFHIIKSGDTLSKIAKDVYGNANLYPKIFEANREVIKDPNLIFPGQKIRLPK
ncbi:MAG: peptidoglycan-binding protein LysM [Methylococcales bacterium]|nr:peptidoglycan-binding protein LysM [Methylococcales bacterium]